VALEIMVFYAVLLTLEGYVIVPVVMGRSMDLNATTVMLACLFWEIVWGLTGLFLAMPLMAAVKAILTHLPDGQAWANLMSTNAIGPPGLAAPKEVPDQDKTQVLLPEELPGADGAQPKPAVVEKS
jgi:hypothetical protein